MKKNNKKGFTLAELLIVVAIIGVLVAISIPIFTSQLEKSRDAVSVANLRSAYAQAQTAILTKTTSDTAYEDDVKYTAGAAAVGSTAATGPVVEVKNVAIKSQNANDWSDLANELPWIGGTLTVKNSPEDEGKAGTYAVKFTYDANLKITKVELEANPS